MFLTPTAFFYSGGITLSLSLSSLWFSTLLLHPTIDVPSLADSVSFLFHYPFIWFHSFFMSLSDLCPLADLLAAVPPQSARLVSRLLLLA